MKLTQKDYRERYVRVQTGEGDDEDRRLVKLYEREGFTPNKKAEGETSAGNSSERSSEQTQTSDEPNSDSGQSPAPTTESHSKSDRAASSTAAPTAGSGSKARK